MLSVVVVHFNIPREFPRTLYSFSPAFQRRIGASDYEVIVVDNGSDRDPDIEKARHYGLNVRLVRVSEPGNSPARALNLGLNSAIGDHIMACIDGARIASPGLLARTVEAMRLSRRAVVGSRGYYLGESFQSLASGDGYTREQEDAMLSRIDWQNNGYSLFNISVLDEASGLGPMSSIGESNSITMHRELWKELNGFSEAFTSPGGGYVNPDTWKRACELPGTKPVVLIGEGTFHQMHGGIATNSTKDSDTRAMFHAEHERIRGSRYQIPTRKPEFFGSIPVPNVDCYRASRLKHDEPADAQPAHDFGRNESRIPAWWRALTLRLRRGWPGN